MKFGVGKNGKTFKDEMIGETLGLDEKGYARLADSSLLTGNDKGAGETNTSLMILEGARYVYYSETNQNKVINSKTLKNIIYLFFKSKR